MEHDEQFYDYAMEVEKQWRTSRPRFTDRELLHIFPEAKYLIRAKLAEWEARRNAVARVIAQKLRVIDHLSAFKNHWFWYKWVSATDGQTWREMSAHIARLKRLHAMAHGKRIKGWITEAQIQRARAVPIERLIETPLRKSGRTLVGLCPLHQETHASFHIYPETNTCWCYGCQQGGDVIAFVRLLRGGSFRAAVAYLLNGAAE